MVKRLVSITLFSIASFLAIVLAAHGLTTPIPAETAQSGKVLDTSRILEEHPEETIFTTMETQSGAPWGLDRIDGQVDGTYSYPSSGAGIRIYIVDTGIDATHREFGSRVVAGFDAFNENLDQTDCQGHGTHVAGIAAGSYYGVAKAATLVPVRVLDCNGVGTTTTVLSGLNWILTTQRGAPGIVNMSLSGEKDSEVDAATADLIAAGFIVTAAAGNSGKDACNTSPAGSSGVIAVGAIDRDDHRASFSNWGNCVDIFAPGTYIGSANALNHAISSQKSGTSQAAPFVAGILATYLSYDSYVSPSDAELQLYTLAEKDAVINGNSSRNDIANVALLPAEEIPAPVVVVVPEVPSLPEAAPVVVDTPIAASPLSPYVSSITPTKVTISWAGIFDANSYVVTMGRVSDSAYSFKKTVSGTDVTLDGIYSNMEYWVVISAKTKDGLDLVVDTSISFKTPYGTPSSPRSVSGDGQKLSWSAPNYDGGDRYLIYVVEKQIAGAWTMIGQTTALSYPITTPDGDLADAYRVYAATEAGASAPSNVARVTGTRNIVPVPDLPSNIAGTVSATQKRAGSGFVQVSWEKLENVASYTVEISPVGVDSWVVAGATTEAYDKRTITAKVGASHQIRVTATLGSGEDVVLGLVQCDMINKS